MTVDKFPRVAVMVLNHNGKEWIHRCLSSVIRTEYPEMQVYLIDNASTDGSVDCVEQSFPDVKIIRHQRNFGVAEGYGRALNGIEADYVALLNNDTEVLDPYWIRQLVEHFAGDPRIAAVACKIVSMEDRSRLVSVGGMGIRFWRGFADIGFEQRDIGQYDYGNFEPFAFCGGAALVKLASLSKVNGFDNKLFMYVEDVDVSWRMRLLGWRVGYAHEALVAHHVGGSTGGKLLTPMKLYYSHRNLLRAILKNCGSSLGWALSNYLLYCLIIGFGYSILQPFMAFALLKAVWWNILNFKDSWAERVKVQSSRRTPESEILEKMYPKLERYEPPEHVTGRRILNILFQHSQAIHRRA